jgi:hypothetical protein
MYSTVTPLAGRATVVEVVDVVVLDGGRVVVGVLVVFGPTVTLARSAVASVPMIAMWTPLSVNTPPLELW